MRVPDGRSFLQVILALACVAVASLGDASVVGAAGFRREGARAERTGAIMGTSYTIKCSATEGVALGAAIEAAEQAMRRIDSLMSTYKPDSELSRFNRQSSDAWFPVSPETAATVHQALEIARQTDGSLDITVGPLVRLWRFGPAKDSDGEADIRLRGVPSDADIDAARERVGFHHLQARLNPPALRKTRPEVDVDLSAIAKGTGVDAAAESLEAHGVTHYMVEIGGEIRARGKNFSGRPWQIGIESPVTDARALERIIPLDGLSLATSGDYRNYFEEEGRRFSHIIDPRTGRPIDHLLASVSVLAPSCAEADGYATALLVMGTDAALAFAEQNDLAVLLISRDPATDAFVEHSTARFEQIVAGGESVVEHRGVPYMLTILLLSLAVFSLAFLALLWGHLRGRPQCECGAARRLMQTVEAREKAKRRAGGGSGDLPILPPDAR